LEDHNITLEYLRKYQVYGLSRTIYAINIVVDGLHIYKGSPLYDMQDQLGLVYLPTTATNDHGNWISTKNPSLTPRERLRRGVETVLLAYKLGYKVLHFNQKADEAKQRLHIIDTSNSKLFKLEVHDSAY
jgi:hypothetical protein